MERLNRANVNSTTRKYMQPLLSMSACLLFVLLLIHFGKLELQSFTPLATQCDYATVCKTSHGQTTGGGSATSGKLFMGEKTNTFDEKLIQFNSFIQTGDVKPQHSAELGSLSCTHWSVVTTIFEPSEAVEKQGRVSNWCLVVVGDKKGPSVYDIKGAGDNVVFLNAPDQVYYAVRYSYEIIE